MILKGNRRGGAKNLALHLMKEENDHVEVHELRGFVAHDLMGALSETYAISKGTRCKKFIYSMSINPPPSEQASTTDFLDAVEKSEKVLKLDGQPRAIVFHEKEGRRHAHVVWSLIDAQEMKAIRLRYDREKLQPLTRDLFIQHGWKMPPGLLDRQDRNPKNFTLEQWQQAKRIGKDPRTIKTAFQDAWAISDSKAAFAQALQERGYVLARGDRRGFVGVDVHGEIYAIPKMIGIRTKAVRERLGDPADLQSIDDAKALIASDMLETLNRFRDEAAARRNAENKEFNRRKAVLVRKQCAERNTLELKQETRETEAIRIRQARFNSGLKGLWDRLRGSHKRTQDQNEREALTAIEHDRAEKDMLILRQIQKRRHLNIFKRELRTDHVRRTREIERDSQTYEHMRDGPPKGPEP